MYSVSLLFVSVYFARFTKYISKSLIISSTPVPFGGVFGNPSKLSHLFPLIKRDPHLDIVKQGHTNLSSKYMRILLQLSVINQWYQPTRGIFSFKL